MTKSSNRPRLAAYRTQSTRCTPNPYMLPPFRQTEAAKIGMTSPGRRVEFYHQSYACNTSSV